MSHVSRGGIAKEYYLLAGGKSASALKLLMAVCSTNVVVFTCQSYSLWRLTVEVTQLCWCVTEFFRADQSTLLTIIEGDNLCVCVCGMSKHPLCSCTSLFPYITNENRPVHDQHSIFGPPLRGCWVRMTYLRCSGDVAMTTHHSNYAYQFVRLTKSWTYLAHSPFFFLTL
jgi:hypothetical protein